MPNTVAQTEFAGNPGISEGQLKGIFLRARQSATVVFNASLLVSSKCAGILNARRFTNNPHRLSAPRCVLRAETCAHTNTNAEIYMLLNYTVCSPSILPFPFICFFFPFSFFPPIEILNPPKNLQKSIILDHMLPSSPPRKFLLTDFINHNYEIFYNAFKWFWSEAFKSLKSIGKILERLHY